VQWQDDRSNDGEMFNVFLAEVKHGGAGNMDNSGESSSSAGDSSGSSHGGKKRKCDSEAQQSASPVSGSFLSSLAALDGITSPPARTQPRTGGPASGNAGEVENSEKKGKWKVMETANTRSTTQEHRDHRNWRKVRYCRLCERFKFQSKATVGRNPTFRTCKPNCSRNCQDLVPQPCDVRKGLLLTHEGVYWCAHVEEVIAPRSLQSGRAA
jgi:hypothetical protein